MIILMITNGTMNNQTKKKKLHQIHLFHQNKPKRKKNEIQKWHQVKHSVYDIQSIFPEYLL